MSENSQPDHKFIPQWVFLLALAVIVAGIGLTTMSQRIKRSVHPVISEIHALNQTGHRDADGELSDWIEIWNPTPETIDLAGYSLTDNFRQLRKWSFPEREIAPGQFLVVFASGKNSTNRFGELHTNFRLDPEGEYLALVAPNGDTRVHELLPKYPRQIGDTSFGIKPEFFQSSDKRLTRKLDDMSFLLGPTPGRPNEIEMLGVVKPVKFSAKRGYFHEPVQVALSVATHGAEIRFTLDGSRPNSTNGVLYTEPIPIDDTATLRAVAYRPGFQSSPVGSHTLIFPKRTVHALAPDLSVNMIEQAIAGFVDLPTVSLMIPDTRIWQTYDSGQNLRASMEWIDPESSDEQIDCGIRISGFGPTTYSSRVKNSFRVTFDDRYGEPVLRNPIFGRRKPTTFNELSLLGGTIGEQMRNSMASLLADTWTRATMQEAGIPVARSRFVHLFLNGAYHGVYNLSELAESPFMPFGDRAVEAEYDVRFQARQISGDSIAWNELNASMNTVLQGNQSVETLDKHVDTRALIDYALVQLFSNPRDLTGTGNWMAVRKRGNSSAFTFLPTFDVQALQTSSTQLLPANASVSPAGLLSVLRSDSKFRAEFRQRAGELLGQGGVLGRERSNDRFEFFAEQLTLAAATESLRWESDPDSIAKLRATLQARLEAFRDQLRDGQLLDQHLHRER